MRTQFENACALTEDLLKENESLRKQVAEGMLHSAPGGAGDAGSDPSELRLRIQELEKERDDLRNRYRELEEMNRSFTDRCQEIELQHNQLANLYVASYQLHTTLNFAEVVSTLKEILINLVGAEAFALFWVGERQGHLRTEASEGTDGLIRDEIQFKGDPLAGAVQAGRSFYADPLPPKGRLDPARPIACIPLRIADRVIGVVAIYRLLEQRERFTPANFELFTLLAGHAATALPS